MKRSLAFVLTLVMLIGLLPLNTFVTEASDTTAITDAVKLTTASEHHVNTDRLYNSIVVNKGQLTSSDDGRIIDSDISGYVENYSPEEGHVLSDFTCTVNEDAGTVTLTKYIGTDAEPVVYSSYTVDGVRYKTVLASETVFRGNTNITEVKLHNGVAFENNSMRYLFAECTKLTAVSLSGVDTTGVTDMSYLFAGTAKAPSALVSVDVTGLNTASVTTMRGMFSYCSRLTTITGYEDWDTGKLESMYQMFNRTSALNTVDLSKWDLDQIKNTGWCFQLCGAQEILLPDNLAVISAGFLNHATEFAGSVFTIPAGVKKIGYAHTIYDFATNDFTEFQVAEGNECYMAVDGILYSADGTEMLAVPRNKTFENGIYEIPEGVTFLGELSFSRNYNITKLVLPNSFVIRNVPLYDEAYIVFEDVGNLNSGTNLSIAIYCYTGITEYEVKPDNPNYTSIDGIIYTKDMTHVVAIPARYAQEIVIPEGVTSWDTEALWADLAGNSNLLSLLANCTGVSIPASLTFIDEAQLDMLNRLAEREDFTITVHEDNRVFRLDAEGKLSRRPSLEGKTISILGDSISTFAGVSDDVNANATLNGGWIYYNEGTLGVSRHDTWWQQTIDSLGLELLVNNSWSGSCIFTTRCGTVGAYADRCVQLHNTAGEEPDIIAVYLGTNDFCNFKSTLGTADAINYDTLIVESEDGYTYAAPATAAEAYAIMLHKMGVRYPDAEIYCFTLLPQRSLSAANQLLLEQFNESIRAIAADFDVAVVDLYSDSGIQADDQFQTYIADNDLHPGPLGMDAITEVFIKELLKKWAPVGCVHTYEAEVTAPTCTEQGYTTHTCTSCGDSFVDSYVDTKGHVEGDVVEENRGFKDGICYVDYVVYCSVCGTELSCETVKLYTLGDVNSDGEINVLDAMVVAQYIVGDITADALNVEAANVNGDGKINVLDAMEIAQYIVGDIAKFSAERKQSAVLQKETLSGGKSLTL